MQEFIGNLKRILPDRRQSLQNCIAIENRSALFIEDSNTVGKSIFVNDELTEEYKLNNCFKLNNPNSKAILLWAIDGCFVAEGTKLSENYPKKCDCVFGYENFIGFIEFKLNADPLAHLKTIRKKREEAIEQIEHTIYFLKETLNLTDPFFEIDGYTIEAYLCTPPTYPNKNTSLTDLALQFLEKHHVDIFEKSEKNCV
jgi:hypothetical protein